MAGVSHDVSRITSMAPIGSTIPLILPIRKERHLLLPSAFRGIDTIAPSGIFCIAIPTDIVRAAIAVIPMSPEIKPESTTPTAIPSGRLWMVTASESIVVRDNPDFIPSGWSSPTCRWGVNWSMASRNPMPSRNPTADGNTCIIPSALAVKSRLGRSSDQNDAATITPEAKPRSDFCTTTFISWRMKNTNDAPMMVPKNGTNNPIAIPSI